MKHTEYIIPIGEEAKEFDEIFIGVLRKHKELIRCKDCKFAPKCYGDIARASKGGGVIYSPLGSNGYCSLAERREK